MTGLIGEMSEFFVKGQRVEPERAERLGFRFIHETLDLAAADLLIEAQNTESPEDQSCSIYYNDACPICDGEIAHYRKLTDADALALRFHEISREATDLEHYRLSTDDLKKRLYVIDETGNMKGGAEAFILVWQQIPRYRWAARVLAWKPTFWLAEMVYDGVVAPCLFEWNRQRDARLAKEARHG